MVAVWQQEQRGRCRECGTFAWEWESDEVPWHADHFTCHGCKALITHQKAVGHNVSDGTKYALYRSDRGD